jgi:hypothetical protein
MAGWSLQFFKEYAFVTNCYAVIAVGLEQRLAGQLFIWYGKWKRTSACFATVQAQYYIYNFEHKTVLPKYFLYALS